MLNNLYLWPLEYGILQLANHELSSYQMVIMQHVADNPGCLWQDLREWFNSRYIVSHFDSTLNYLIDYGYVSCVRKII